MASLGDGQSKRRLKVNMADLEMAFDHASLEASYYLDKQTGSVVTITDEVRRDLEEIYDEIYGEDGGHVIAFEQELSERDVPKWQKEAIREAHLVESGYGSRFIRVPEVDSSEAYRDVEDFIATVRDARLSAPVEVAIDEGRGAFRRFKEVLARYPGERERWFRFQSNQLRRRILEWLEEEGIEPVLE